MARKITYKCSSCGYTADIYEGKGLFGQHITPVWCPDCRSIANLVVGGVIGDVAPSFSSEAGRLCPLCGSNKIIKWDMHACPRCNGEMKAQEETGFWT